jgi:hypothetical protein
MARGNTNDPSSSDDDSDSDSDSDGDSNDYKPFVDKLVYIFKFFLGCMH